MRRGLGWLTALAAAATAIAAIAVLLPGWAEPPAGAGAPARGAVPATVPAADPAERRPGAVAAGLPYWGEFPLQAHAQSFAQGIRGRVVDHQQQPLAGAAVWLVPGSWTGFTAALKHEGASLLRTASGADGRFALGIDDPDLFERADLWVLAEGIGEQCEGGLRLAPHGWLDLGTIALRPSVPVSGRVTRRQDGMPIPGAEVSFVPYARQHECTFVPGREHGLTARTDEEGRFRLQVPPMQTLVVQARATGCAPAERAGVHLRDDAPNHFEFALDPGVRLEGIVLDSSGAPVPAVRLRARASDEGPRRAVEAVVFSDLRGRFHWQGLRAGPHQIEVMHEAYAAVVLQEVAPGTAPLTIRLRRLSSVRVQVLGNDGEVLPRFEVRVLAETGAEGVQALTAISARQMRADRSGHALLAGLPPASHRYVIQASAKDHAHAFSAPFALGCDEPPRTVCIQLDRGGEISGTVRDAAGMPLAGVDVQTLPVEIADAPDAMYRLREVPARITMAQARTDREGGFRLPLLHPGEYVLRLTHPDSCATSRTGILVRRGEIVRLDDLRLSPGTVVSGRVDFGGPPPRFCKVLVATRFLPGEPQRLVHGEAIVARDGSFRIEKHFPPGRYRLAAGALAKPGVGEPLLGGRILFDEVRIDGTQRELRLDLRLPAR